MCRRQKQASRKFFGNKNRADLIAYSEAALATILSPRYFVTVRRTLGGPAPEETARAAGVSRQLLAADDAWWEQATNALADAEHRLAERSAAL